VSAAGSRAARGGYAVWFALPIPALHLTHSGFYLRVTLAFSTAPTERWCGLALGGGQRK